MNSFIKLGLILAGIYLILHVSIYYIGGNSLMGDIGGWEDGLFVLINFPVNLIIGTFSHNSIYAVNTKELFMMGVIGTVIYFLLGLIITLIKNKIKKLF